MSGRAHCGGGITAFDIVSRTRTARYHEDCRTRELGLPYEPWFPIRVALALRDALAHLLAALLDSEGALGSPSGYRNKRSARERSDEMGMKHGDPWL